jgi:hypothetical protein
MEKRRVVLGHRPLHTPRDLFRRPRRTSEARKAAIVNAGALSLLFGLIAC